jgi:hypothetical protein
MELSAEQKLQKLNDAQKERSLAYYHKNAEIINEKRKSIYVSKKQDKLTKLEIYADNIYFKFIDTLDIKPSTKITYQGNLCRVLDLIGEQDLVDVINQNKLPNLIDSSKFEFSTKKNICMNVLCILNKMEIELDEPIFDNIIKYMTELDRQYTLKHMENQQKEVVLSFSEYLEKVEKYFGKFHTMHLLASMYSECGCRDDLQLIILNKKPDELKENYLILNENQHEVILTKFKTDKKYQTITVVLSEELSNLINKYIEINKLNENDYLFGNQLQSAYIRYNNKLLGLNIGINALRRMKVSEVINNKSIPVSEHFALAKQMGHSPQVQMVYLRNLKKIE